MRDGEPTIAVLPFEEIPAPEPARAWFARGFVEDLTTELSRFSSLRVILRVTARLVEPATQRQLWAERYDAPLAQLQEIQQEITASVASALALSIDYSDLPLFDLLFGTFRNPAAWQGEAGFWDGASARVGDLLLGRDVTRPPPAAVPATRATRPLAS